MTSEQFLDPAEPLEVKFDVLQPMPQQQEALIWQEHLQQARIPLAEEFQGDFNFQLAVDTHDDNNSCVFSPRLKKVFIKMEETLPVRIEWVPQRSGLYIRAVMAFCQPATRSEPVVRCLNHAAGSNQGNRRVLNCNHTDAQYSEVNGHHFVRVPLGTPQPGSDAVQMDFTFHCKNSCFGINRRPTEVVFNLEDEVGVVLGRSNLLVRICNCSRRERNKEENLIRESPAPKRRKLASGEQYMPIYRKQTQPESDSRIFTFSARIYGRDNVEFLKHYACSLMALTMERDGQAATIMPLINAIMRMRKL